MAMNHIESDVRLVTDQVLGFVSSAEGFIFLSGLVAGWVYSRRLRERGTEIATTAIHRRMGEIYRMHLLTYFGSFVWMVLFIRMTGDVPPLLPGLFAAEPWTAVVLGPPLLYQPGLLDILPLYCVFFLALPSILRALASGRTVFVLAGSALLWAAAQCASGPVIFWGGRINLGAFHPLAWQFLFVAGAAIGVRRTSGEATLKPAATLIAATAAAAAVFWALRHGSLAFAFPPGGLGRLVDKTLLGPLRLANFACLAYLFGCIGAVFPRVLQIRSLAFIGQASLPVFAAQALVAMVVLTYPELFFFTPAGRWSATAAMVVTVFGTAGVSHWLRKRRAVGADRAVGATPSMAHAR